MQSHWHSSFSHSRDTKHHGTAGWYQAGSQPMLFQKHSLGSNLTPSLQIAMIIVGYQLVPVPCPNFTPCMLRCQSQQQAAGNLLECWVEDMTTTNPCSLSSLPVSGKPKSKKSVMRERIKKLSSDENSRSALGNPVDEEKM